MDLAEAFALVTPDQYLQLRTGQIIAVHLGSASAITTVDVVLGGGQVNGIPVLGWYTPVNGAVVNLLQQGPLLLCIGPVGPPTQGVPPAAKPPPAPPAPPPPPAPLTKTVTIACTATHSYQDAYSQWRTDNDDVYQGGTGTHRGFWFYGAAILTAIGTGTLVSGTIYIKRASRNHGINGGANVYLGTHNLNSQPGGAPTPPGTSVKVGTLTKGQGKSFPIPAAHIAQLNAGTMRGFGLVTHGLGSTSADYCIGNGKSSQASTGQLSLTIRT